MSSQYVCENGLHDDDEMRQGSSMYANFEFGDVRAREIRSENLNLNCRKTTVYKVSFHCYCWIMRSMYFHIHTVCPVLGSRVRRSLLPYVLLYTYFIPLNRLWAHLTYCTINFYKALRILILLQLSYAVLVLAFYSIERSLVVWRQFVQKLKKEGEKFKAQDLILKARDGVRNLARNT